MNDTRNNARLYFTNLSRSRFEIFPLVLNLSELIDFCSSWNQKMVGFVMILGGDRSQLIPLNSLNIRSKIYWQSLTRIRKAG